MVSVFWFSLLFSTALASALLCLQRKVIFLKSSVAYLTMKRTASWKDLLLPWFYKEPQCLYHCASANWERAPCSRLWWACAEAHPVEIKQFSLDQFGLRFSETYNEARLQRGFFFFVPLECKQHLISTYLLNVSSLIVSTDVLAGCFSVAGFAFFFFSDNNMMTKIFHATDFING